MITKTFNLFLLIFILSITFLSCNNKTPQGLYVYYFSPENLGEYKVYKFINKNKIDQITYWEMYHEYKDGDTLLHTNIFNDKLEPIEVFIEKWEGNKTKVIQYDFIEKGKQGEILRFLGNISKNDVFSADEADYPVQWETLHKGIGRAEKMTKTRIFKDKEIKINVNNKDYTCLKFRDNFVGEYINSGQKIRFYQDSYYAKGLGLLRYERYWLGGVVMDWQLEEILDKASFDRLKDQ
ncbi:MAG: hypothetical protein MK212_11520 [Saprospiraceae bacterium]|nr:hypothetical protein [Saprospiraceae bacterium]